MPGSSSKGSGFESPVSFFTLRNSCVKVFRDDSLTPAPYRARVDYRLLPMQFGSLEGARQFIEGNLERIRVLDDAELKASVSVMSMD
jgi:hypothetical protein